MRQLNQLIMRISAFATALAVTLLAAATATAASPSLTIIVPRGVQRGKETQVVFSGARLADAEEILFYTPGVTAKKIEPGANANQIKVTLEPAADCRLGEHVAQVRTKSGISEYRTFYVGNLPDVAEKEPNTDFEAPQAIPLGSTVTGIVQNEDVDYFVVDAKKGQRISAEVEGMRLGVTMFDPYVAILDAKRFELSANDDTPLALQDCFASVVAPEDGKYVVEVRESAYAGNGNCHYRLHVGTFPRPTAVYPAGGKLGEEVEVSFLGVPTGEMKQKVKLPAEPDEDFGVFAQDAGGVAASPNTFRLFEHGNAFEVEPNEDFATATPVALPNAFNGIIEKPGDVDVFKFAAKKGQVFEVECYARRVRSGLDSVMNLYYADGRGIAGNDDSRGPDSYYRFSVPADGEYCIRVTDHLGRGGPDFVYRLEFQPIKPTLTLGIPRVARYSQDRQTIYVPRGNRFATLISASRVNFGGDLVMGENDLPQGLTVHAEPMPANMNLMPVVFEAAADAPLGGKLVDFTMKHADPNQKISGGFNNRADFVIANPGQSLYRWRDVDQLAVAVVEELPFTIEIVEPKSPLVQNGSMQLKVVAHKKEGWDEQINVQFPFHPPGVSAASSVNIPKGQNEVLYPLNANGNAQIKKWKVYALGSANVNGNAWVSSQLANLEVAAPYASVAMDRTAVEQGQKTEIVAKFTHNAPFEGNAKIVLQGLPNKVTAPEMEFNKDTKEVVFQVATDPTSPAGRHTSVFAQIFVPMNGEQVVHRHAGGTELRIDPPPPMPVVKKEPEKKPEPTPVAKTETPQPAPKRLSRLEQLRLDAKKRAEAAAGGSK